MHNGLLYNKSTNQLTAQGQEIFDIIWGKTTFRTNLFENIDFTLPDAVIKPMGLREFKDKISSLSDSFYNFIKVK